MSKKFKVGEHVSWSSDSVEITGTIIKVHTRDFEYKGHSHRATKVDPQYEIKNDTSQQIFAHRATGLRKAM